MLSQRIRVNRYSQEKVYADKGRPIPKAERPGGDPRLHPHSQAPPATPTR